MKTKKRFRTLAVALLAACTAAAQAAPFAITYTGRMSPPEEGQGSGEFLPELVAGESYTLTLIFDNGGDTARNQRWGGEDLTCVLFRMNDARDAAYAEDLAAVRPRQRAAVEGQARTNANGNLTALFTRGDGVQHVPFTGWRSSRGLVIHDGVDWRMASDIPLVFMAGRNVPYGRWSFYDAAGGVQMHPARWTDPLPFSGNCDADAVPPAPAPGSGGSQANPVPAISTPALALLTLGAAGLAMRRLRRNS